MKNSAFVRSRKHCLPIVETSFVALSALASTSMAQQVPSAPEKESLPEIVVKAQRAMVEPYKVEKSASTKMTQPLLDTPKTVQVINKEVIREQGAASLMEALRNTPGITMQLGENGSTSAGDTFQMRGFSTQSSTFVDGVRDLGAVSRDVFNLEQVEVVKGPAGADIGRGAASGYVNLISKLPTRDDANEGTITLGTGQKKRATVDLDRRFGETSAFRINAMVQDSGVDGKDYVKQKGHALAPSLAFGLGTPTRTYLYSQHVRQDNRPDGGIPTVGIDGFFRVVTTAGNATSIAKAAALNAADPVNRSNYYGSVNDYEKVVADMYTAKLEHDLGGNTTIRNITRFGKTRMDRVLTGLSGSITDDNIVDVANPSTWTIGRTRQRVDQTNEMLTNQTSINSSLDLFNLKHDVVAGLEYIYERQLNLGSGTTAQNINGVAYTAITNPAANLYNPNANDFLGTPYLTGANTFGKTVTTALYAMDTVTLSPSLKVNAGLRLDSYDTTATVGSIESKKLVNRALSDEGLLKSWNAGLVYKPTEKGSVYAAYANSTTPPGSANAQLSTSASNASNPAFDPQKTSSVEVGTKWDLLNDRLNVTAAIYQTTNDKQVSYNDLTDVYTQQGKTKVSGIELGLVGQITNFWQVTAGVAKMKTSQKDQYSYSSNSGLVSASDGVRWSPEWAATAWTSYTLDSLTVGGGLRYVSEQKRLITTGSDPATTMMPNIPGYTVASMMVAYKATKNLNLQLNVENLFDKEYISTLNSGGGRLVLGVPRSASLTASLKF